MSQQPIVSPVAESELVVRYVRVRTRDVVFVKGIFEASEGLGAMFAKRGGDLTLAAPASRQRELDALLVDLARDVGAILDFERDTSSSS